MRRFCLGIALLLGLGVMTTPAAAGISEFLSLTPETATNPVGTNHTLTATVTDNEEQPRSDRQVAFVVTAGPNIGKTGDDCTNDEGQATFTYTGDGGAGTDTITATAIGSCDLVVNTLGNGVTDSATKTWVAASPPPPPGPPPGPPPAAPPSPPPAAGAAPSGALPFTGFPVWIILLAAAGLIGAGAWLLPRARKTQ